MHFDLPVNLKILNLVAHLDHFRGSWTAGKRVPSNRRGLLLDEARVQSTLTACRMGGIRVTEKAIHDRSIHGNGHGRGAEILGFLYALEAAHLKCGEMLTARTIQSTHAIVTGQQPPAPRPTPWRETQLDRETFDNDGKALGRIFTTLPPHILSDTVENLITWMELELRSREQHPLLVIGTFTLALTAAGPFESANGRVIWVLLARLLERAGYTYVPFAPLLTGERLERDAYYDALDRSQDRIWSGEADLVPWLTFFLETLVGHAARIEAMTEDEHDAARFSPLQRKIVDTVRRHGSAEAGMLMRITGANRNTLKDNLRRLVDQGLLERLGKRRGTRYRMPE